MILPPGGTGGPKGLRRCPNKGNHKLRLCVLFGGSNGGGGSRRQKKEKKKRSIWPEKQAHFESEGKNQDASRSNLRRSHECDRKKNRARNQKLRGGKE